MTGDGTASAPRGCAEALASAYDVALLDLDGVVYIGASAVAGAVGSLAKARAAGLRVAFVTNNASRTPSAIAAQLTSLGVPASASEVVTSAQAGARLLAERLPPTAAVLVVGGMGLRVAVRERGFRPVSVASERPAAVIQGYAPDIEGAVRVGADSLLVLTGVTHPVDAVLAPPHQRPSYLAADLSGLLMPHLPVTQADGDFTCGGWHARWLPPRLVLGGGGDRMDGLRALCAASWAADGVTAAAVTPALAQLGW
jgi:ribonucleotide monophosphatase NagD (HAD superfamily)